jgi:predicted branched-subunit amino acid permease
MLVATALAGSYWLAVGSSAYSISYSSYPHTEIIGLQLSYIGLFILIISTYTPSHSLERLHKDKLMVVAGLLLVVMAVYFMSSLP